MCVISAGIFRGGRYFNYILYIVVEIITNIIGKEDTGL